MIGTDGSRLQIGTLADITSVDPAGFRRNPHIPEVKALGDRLDAMLPRVCVTELLHEVGRGTGFLNAFTNFRTGEACPNENALLAAILADATNL